MKEIWKDIIGYEGQYRVSNQGTVTSVERRVWNGHKMVLWPAKQVGQRLRGHHGGYPAVELSKENKKKPYSVHRLLAIHFIPNPLNKPEVNHINGIKTDYRLENLEWCTRRENMHHADRTGLRNVSGENNYSAKLSPAQVQEIRSLRGKYSQRALGKMYGVEHCTIGSIHRGESWRLRSAQNGQSKRDSVIHD